MRPVFILLACSLLLSACSHNGVGSNDSKTMSVIGGVYPLPIIDPSVETFGTEGGYDNPLNVDRTHSVLDNTTAGGYTVFDESVKVYPLPGDTVPSYVPLYAVPPLQAQDDFKPVLADQMPVELATMNSNLPPVPSMDVQEEELLQPRQPLTLTKAEPLTMQPPVAARPLTPSPFVMVAPMVPPVATPPSVVQQETRPMQPQTTPGRRSAPLLTGY